MKRKKYNGIQTMELTTPFRFGKYYKKKLLEVIQKDNNYINWAIETGIIKLSYKAEYFRNNGIIL